MHFRQFSELIKQDIHIAVPHMHLQLFQLFPVDLSFEEYPKKDKITRSHPASQKHQEQCGGCHTEQAGS